MSPFLQTALDAVKAAEAVIQRYYKNQFDVQLKEDQSPVTIADIESEKTIKRVIQNAFPEHGFYGEETGKEGLDKEYIWLVDPIDGTKSFVRDYPFFSTQIALWHKGEIIVGVSNAPVFGEIAYAEKGQGAYLQYKPIKVSNITTLEQAALSTGNVKTLAQSDKWVSFGELLAKMQRTRGYGDFYHYHLLAAGKLEIIVESDVNILDIAALSLIIQEAGGVFTDMSQKLVDFDTTSVVACNSPALYKQVMAYL